MITMATIITAASRCFADRRLVCDNRRNARKFAMT